MTGHRLLGREVAAVIFLLIGSVIAYGQPSSGANWLSPDGNTPLNWNYSPQDVITSKNVEELTLQWVIPIPAAFTRGENEGVGVTPLVVNGIVYYVTNWHRILALDSRGTKVVWFIDPPTSVLKEIGTGHYRQIMYTQETRGKPLVWVGPDNFHILAYAALTSDRELLLSATNQSEVLSGNYGVYGRYESHFIIDDHRGVLVAGGEGTGTTNAGRGFFRAFSLNDLTPRPLWTTFITPPQDGSDPSWSARSVESMSHAWIFNGLSAVDLKGLSTNQLNSALGGDWGGFGFNGTRSFAGAGVTGSGPWAVDEETGIVYVGTGSPGPAWNATARPGPNLWSDSILAINETNGKIVWGFQTTAHDVWGFGCSWNIALATFHVGGHDEKVVFKACDNGILYALDATTGKMIWYFRQPDLKYSKCVFGAAGQLLHDPLDRRDMTTPWECYPSKVVVQNPQSTGGVESDVSYDPNRNMVFFVGYNTPITLPIVGVGPDQHARRGETTGANLSAPQQVTVSNATVYGLDASSGSLKWKHTLTGVSYTSGVTVSGGAVYVMTTDGYMNILDEDSGRLIVQKSYGGPFYSKPALAQDITGLTAIFVASSLPPSYPGAMEALGLLGGPSATTNSSSTQTSVQVAYVPEWQVYLSVLVVAVIAGAMSLLVLARRRSR